MGTPDFEQFYRDTITRFVKADEVYHSEIERINEALNTDKANLKSSHKSKIDKLDADFSSEGKKLDTSRENGFLDIGKRRKEEISALTGKMSELAKESKSFLNSAESYGSEAKDVLDKVGLVQALSSSTGSESILIHSEGPFDSVISDMSKISAEIYQESNDINHAVNRLLAFRKHRKRVRRTFFSLLVAILLVLAFIGGNIYNQYEIYHGYVEASDAFQHENWQGVYHAFEKLEKNLDLQRTTFYIFSNNNLSSWILSLLGVPEWNITGFDVTMLEMESHYREGVKAFAEKDWVLALREFQSMKNAEEEYISTLPLGGYRRQGVVEKIKKRRILYASRKRQYQKERGLKEYFSDISVLRNDALYRAGMVEYNKGEWKKALGYFNRLPGDEKYQKLIVECQYNLAVALFENHRWAEAYSAFKKIEGYKDANRMLIQILIKTNKAINVNAKGTESNVKSPNTVMTLEDIVLTSLEKNWVNIHLNLSVQITANDHTTVLSPHRVWIETPTKRIYVSEWGGCFSGNQKIKEFSFRGRSATRDGWIKVSEVPLVDIMKKQQWTLHYGSYYTIYFEISLPNSI